ncbi:MAG: hypothetical protein AMXMBFR64_26900 [Myxococcales bacterium]
MGPDRSSTDERGDLPRDGGEVSGLAVDLGLRTGLALYGGDGRLIWYRSQHFGSAATLRRGVLAVVRGLPALAWLVAEGDRALAEIWGREAKRQGATVHVIGAEVWRRRLLHAREQRAGEDAKRAADRLARRVIAWSGAPSPTSLRHDAAEAILIGLWGVLEAGWLERLPPELGR